MNSPNREKEIFSELIKELRSNRDLTQVKESVEELKH